MRLAIPVLVLSAVLSASALAAERAKPVPPSPGSEGWRKDLAFLASELPKLRPEAFTKELRAAWDRDVATLQKSVPSMTDGDVKAELFKLVASVGNPAIRLQWTADRTFVVSLFGFPDGYRVVRVPEQYKRALGARVVAIGGKPLEEVVGLLASFARCEDDGCRRETLPRLLVSAEILRGLKVVPPSGTATYTFDDGSERFSLDLPAAAPRETNVGTWAAIPDPAMGAVPIYLRKRDESYWYEHQEGTKTLYVLYGRTKETEGRPLRAFVDEVLRTATERPTERIVLDLRRTTGDDEKLLAPFIEGLESRPALRAKGRLFVIVGRTTYPAALENARTLRMRFGAIVAGESPPRRPRKAPAIKNLQLPASKLAVSYPATSAPGAPMATPLMPDLPVSGTFEDLEAGRDAVLDAILAYRPPA